jgi:Tat protein translocase TatB subunit
MIDLGISKLALIGAVALIVIGPERLPKVARTVGALVGRAQRYINDVKAEVSARWNSRNCARCARNSRRRARRRADDPQGSQRAHPGAERSV